MVVEKENVVVGARRKGVLVAQEIAFAKILAGNNKTLRDRGVKRLARWLKVRSDGRCEFTDDDFMRIWKGLFYCMWMADKPLVQEELAERVSRLIHCLSNTDLAIVFIRCFFHTMVTEWYGIDQFRYDKFLMFVRRFLRQTFEFCRTCRWDADVIQKVCSCFSTTILSTSTSMMTHRQPGSLIMHFCDIYLQEIAKVSQGTLPVDMLTLFLQPFISYLAEQEDGRLRNKVESDVFRYLMKQCDAGIELEETRGAWKAAGCSPGIWGETESADGADNDVADSDLASEISDIETAEFGPLDPRAGRVDVELPQLQFDAQGIAETLLQQSQICVRKRNRHLLESLAEKFKKLAAGTYPSTVIERLVNSKPKVERYKLKNKHIDKAALRLIKREKNEGRRRGRKNKHRHKKLDRKATVKNNDDAVGTSSSDRMVDEVTGKIKDTSTSVTEVAEVCGDYDVADDCVPKEAASIGATENKIEEDNTSKKETEKNCSENPRAASCMKRKCGLLLTDFENLDVGVQPLKVQRKDSPTTLKVAKDKKIEGSKKKLVCNITAKSSTSRGRMSVGGDWEVTDVAESNMKSNGAVKAVVPSGGKKVNIVLTRNSAQGVRDYHMSVRRSPGIPFDAKKKPGQGVLKPCTVGSRVNPFYELNKKKCCM